MSTLYLKKYGYIILCVGSVQMRSFFWSVFSRIRTDRKSDTEYLSVFSSNAGKYGPGKTPYLDTFHAVLAAKRDLNNEGKVLMIQIST